MAHITKHPLVSGMDHNFIALDASTYSQMVRVYCTKCGLQRRLPLKKDE